MTEAQLITNGYFVDHMYQFWFRTGRLRKFSEFISDEIRTVVAATSGDAIADIDRHKGTAAA